VTRPKKTPPALQEEIIAPDRYRHAVGKGITKRYVYTRGIPGSRLRYDVTDDYPLGSLSRAKEWAEKYLKKAGLPAYEPPSHPPALPWGTGSSVQARRYRERQGQEWYAYEILEAFSEISKVIIRGDVVILNRIEGIRVVWPALEMAYRLGNLATEAQGLGYYQKTGAEGPPKRERQKSPWPTLADYLLRNYPDGNDEHRFDMVPNIKKDDDIRVGNRHRYYRKDGRIHAEVKVKGEWKVYRKTLKISGLRKHLTEARIRRDR